MKGIPLFLLMFLECCKSGATPPSPPLTATQIAAELEEAGCLQAGPGVADAVAAELATGHDAWLSCLQDAGTIVSCNVPCQRAGYVRRPTGD